MAKRRSIKAEPVPAEPVPAEPVPASPEPEREIRPPERPTDPMELIEDQIPIYNPNPFAIDIQASGQFFHVRAEGVDFVPDWAADHAVGVDNAGGPWSKIGIRRLYGPEPRFAEAAKLSGKTLEEWVRHRNRVVQETAREVMNGTEVDMEAISAVELSRG